MEEKKFDVNTAIGLLLIGAVLIYMTWSSGQGDEPIPETSTEQIEASTTDDVSTESNAAVIEAETESDPIKEELAVQEDSTGALSNGLLLPEAGAVEREVVLENEELRIVFSSKGGSPKQIELKNSKTYFGDPLYLVDSGSARYNVQLEMGSQIINSSEQYFEILDRDDSKVVFGLRHKSGAEVSFEHELDSEQPYQLNFGTERSTGVGKTANVQWNALALRQEKSFKNEKNNTSIFYRSEGEVDDLGVMKADNSDEASSADWLGFKGQFFTSLFYTDGNVRDLKVAQRKPELENNVYVAEFSVEFEMTLGEEGKSFWFFGPNEFKTLRSYKLDLTEMIPLGWGIFGWINMWMVIPLFGFFQSLGWNYGIIILIMAILVKVILSPFQIKSYISMAKMRVLKPEIDEINEKYDDQMKKQQAMMDLYKSAGANPLGGCLPMLFQMPFLIAMFRFFPSSIELRGQSFLWADDLSSFDSIFQLPFDIPFYGDHISLFTVLMAISMFFYTKFNQQMTPSTGGNQMAQQMKVISYLMPVMMLFWFNSYASGLSYYYFLANVISFAQQGIIRKFFIDEDAIHAKMQAKKAQPAKKGKFQQRLDTMMKEQNRQARRK